MFQTFTKNRETHIFSTTIVTVKTKNLLKKQKEEFFLIRKRVIAHRITNFHSMWNYLTSGEAKSEQGESLRFDTEPEVAELALRLSLSELNKEDAVARMMKLNDIMFYEHKLELYLRLKAAGEAAISSGNIDEITQETIDLVKIMQNDGHSQSDSSGYFVWYEVAQIRQFPGGSLQEKYKRFEEIGGLLENHGFTKRSIDAEIIQLMLGKQEGTFHDLVAKYNNLYQAFIGEGATEGLQTNIAAAILMEAHGTDEDRAKAFMNAIETMTSMVEKNPDATITTEDYPLAAALMSEKGNIEENFSAYLDTLKVLKEKGFENNLWSRALEITKPDLQNMLQNIQFVDLIDKKLNEQQNNNKIREQISELKNRKNIAFFLFSLPTAYIVSSITGISFGLLIVISIAANTIKIIREYNRIVNQQ